MNIFELHTQDYQNHNRNQQNKCALILEISVAQASPLFTLEKGRRGGDKGHKGDKANLRQKRPFN